MATQDQLEIITATGHIEFYNLDPGKGLTNIGQHPENDIVIDDPEVAPFHAMLDHRHRPYQLILLSQQGQTRLRGQQLSPNGGVSLQNLDTLQLGSYTLILVEGQGGAAPATGAFPPASGMVIEAPTTPVASPFVPGPPARLPARPVPITPPVTRPEPMSLPAPVTLPVSAPPSPGIRTAAMAGAGLYSALPPNRSDEVILTELSDSDWTVNVDQTVVFEVTITNGGPIVAAFMLTIQGLDESWVTVSQPYVNLNEGERAVITVTIMPPRLPTSRAGSHYFAVIATSSNYPGRYSQHGATLIINPYYEFTLGELSPKQQTISWFKHFGQAYVSIINKGNSNALFTLEGTDDERGCYFEFQVPGEEVGLARQAELRLPPDTTITVPTRITPHKRRLFGLRGHNYAFTITAKLAEGEQAPRSQLGQLKHKPLLGIWQILLIALLLILLILYIFRPVIYLFSAEPKAVRAGDEVILRWRASPFANLRINGGIGPVEGSIGEATVIPEETILYELRGENWVSWLTGGFFSYVEEERVIVNPVFPEILAFQSDRETLFTGEEAILSWEVADAEDVILETNGVPQTLPPEMHSGQQAVTPDGNTTYSLKATNRYGEVIENVEIRVDAPPVPTPFIRRFTVNPQAIVAGESVVLDWEVEGADRVAINPIGEVPPIGSVSQSPLQNTNYVLIASNGPAQNEPIIRQVVVSTPTPGPTATPEPLAPVIEFFTISPDEIIKGESEDITLAWSISGDTTGIEISGPALGVVTGLSPQGSIVVSADEATLYVLTASNGGLNASQTVQLRDEDPTPTPSPTVPPTPAPTNTPTPPPPVIVFFQAEGDRVTFKGDDRYEILAPADVQLSWEVINAETVTLNANGTTQNQRLSDEKTIDNVTQDQRYELEAQNKDGVTVRAFIEIEAIAPAPPAPPTNVQGQLNGGQNEIQWIYSDKDQITGYRVYRADVPDGDFNVITQITDKNITTFTDPDTTTCGKAYYITAVYIDIVTNQPRETDASTNSWLSTPCP